MINYKKMCEIIPVLETTSHKVIHKVLTLEEVKVEKFRAIWDIERYREVVGLEPGTYVVLFDKEKKEIVMSDTWMEQYTNDEIIRKAHGNVLIAGLGIGLILLPMQEKAEVESITIIEKSQELIDTMKLYLPLNNKIRIVQGDIFQYETKEQYDTIYFDIWNHISTDNYEEMKKLHKKFRKNLNKQNPNKIIDSWRLRDCKRKYLAEKREERQEVKELEALKRRIKSEENYTH